MGCARSLVMAGRWWPIKGLAVVIVLVLAAGLSGWAWFDGRAVVAEIPTLPVQALEECVVVGPQLHNGEDVDAERATLWTNGAVLLKVCGPGTLRFAARGSVAHGYGSYMVVGWNTETLWEGVVVEERGFEISVPGAGWLAVAFVNDLYDPPEDRNLWLSGISFE